MILKIVDSGSQGNCYILDNGKHILLLDCGVKFSEINEALDFDLTRVMACIATHGHSDHMKSAKDLMKRGIDVYASEGTHHQAGTKMSHRAVKCLPLKPVVIGTYQVFPFEVEHDAQEPFGYVIYDLISKQRLLFATDTNYLKYTFKKIDHYLIECNYDEETISHNREIGVLDENRYKRVVSSHMGLETLIKAIKSHKSTPKTITLIHLSNSNINQDRASAKIYTEFGLLPNVADAGITIELT